MLDFFKKLFGTKADKDVKEYKPVIDKINSFAQQYQAMSNDELRNNTTLFRERIASHLAGINGDIEKLESSADTETDLFKKEGIYDQIDAMKKERDGHLEVIMKAILPEAFATVKETARRFSTNTTLTVSATDHDRKLAVKKNYISINGDEATYQNSWTAAGGEITWNMIHYDVQLIGGMVLHDGKIAEMATGEGKTLVATLPAYLNGLTGFGMHVITVNDYLAKRDSEWIGPIFEFLLLTIDCIDKYKPNSKERIAAYNSDITYGTNNEFGFDYLRDNMTRSVEDKVQGKHHFAMVDEVDSVLIDDARTPLIISGPVEKGADEEEYIDLNPKVKGLFEAQKRLATEYLAEARKLFGEGKTGYNEGEGGLALLRAHRAYPKNRPLIKFLSEEGVKVMFQKAENHYMAEQNKNMPIADKPLYFTIEEKTRSVELTEKGIDYLSKGERDENFFMLPDIAASMQQIVQKETAQGLKLPEERQQLISDYSNKSRRIHAVQQLLKAYTLFEKDQEYVVIEGEVKIVDEQTGRMMEGRRYSDGLHQALEAKENVKVGEITQTYATITLQNYFRMYHKLAGMTGTAETEASELWQIYKLDVVVIPTNRPITRQDQEDLVYKTTREKFNAVVDEIEILTSKGRPVLVGTTSVDISETLSRFLERKGIQHNVLNAKQHQREAEIVAEAGKPGKVTIATNMAGRGTDIKINDEVKKAGGLAIIATERHDSRRVDRQLRGRAGRQGDPGTSQFYVSLEDNLMRMFQSDRIASVMDKMGHKDGEVIQHSMISKSIERAQKKVEENNFGIRKRLLEYDDVMNIQRSAIYKKRNNALEGDRLAVDVFNMFESLGESIVVQYKGSNDYQGFINECLTTLSFDPEISETQFKETAVTPLVHLFQEKVENAYDAKKKALTEMLYPIFQNVQQIHKGQYKRMHIPLEDGTGHPLYVTADLEKGLENEGASIMQEIEQAVVLALIDDNWKEHLRNMDDLKDASQAASFEQKDPLVIYKMQAYKYFEELIHSINMEVVSYLMRSKLVISGENVEEAKAPQAKPTNVTTNKEEDARKQAAQNAGQQSDNRIETIVKSAEERIGRNEPCPCGSGKKYKHCHGK
jgi:preprotein translocase subunit SecA